MDGGEQTRAGAVAPLPDSEAIVISLDGYRDASPAALPALGQA